MSPFPSVLPNSAYLPGDLHTRRAAGDPETVILDFLGDVQVRRQCADGGQLVVEIPVESFKPEIQDFLRFQSSMVEVFVPRVELMVDLKILSSGNIQIT